MSSLAAATASAATGVLGTFVLAWLVSLYRAYVERTNAFFPGPPRRRK